MQLHSGIAGKPTTRRPEQFALSGAPAQKQLASVARYSNSLPLLLKCGERCGVFWPLFRPFSRKLIVHDLKPSRPATLDCGWRLAQALFSMVSRGK
jgi:hypothetical protein